MPERDSKMDPKAGDTATRKRRPVLATIRTIRRHLNSEDIAYIEVDHEVGREKWLILLEWENEYRDHQAGELSND